MACSHLPPSESTVLAIRPGSTVAFDREPDRASARHDDFPVAEA